MKRPPKALHHPPRQSKYNAKPTVVDGICFASIAESHRYRQLKLMEKAGAIHGLALQVPFPLIALGDLTVGNYIADFVYYTHELKTLTFRVVEDVKGFTTPLAKWKLKHFEAQYGQKVRIINKKTERAAWEQAFASRSA